LGVRLLHRTTRKLSLTEEGEVFYARCQDVLKGVEEAEAEVTSRAGQAFGLIKINAPVTFGVLHLAALWGDFMAKHPKVNLDITLSDRVVDLVDEGFDIAIRIARLANSSLVSRKLASTRMVLCASPTYLRKAGKPKHPEDLAHHAVLAYSYWSGRDEWTFEGPEGAVTVKTRPCIRSNSGDTCRAGALQHRGLILQPTFLVGDDLRSGALVEVLPPYRSVELGIYAMFPTRQHVTPKVRLLIDFLVASLKKPRWPE
jgi:DNA-binding transcriptional LysR family regulator